MSEQQPNIFFTDNYIENIPSKRIKALTWAVFLLLCAILLFASLIQYPDTEPVNVVLTTKEQRGHLIARTVGNIHFCRKKVA